MILAGEYAGTDAVERFMAEAEIVARLQHPSIVQIHAIGDCEGRPYVELEYIEGGSLAARLDGKPWPPRDAAGLIEILASAMAEAHRMGIVHRDLKPANILFADDGTPKITDFGLAKSIENDSDLTRTHSILGSPNYMAPEQADGHARDVGPTADVYALGTNLYELLTGRPPFVGPTILATLDLVKNVEPVAPRYLQPDVASDLETICLKCLRKEPQQRYESAEALAQDLARYLDGKPILARPTPHWERAWKWVRRRPLDRRAGHRQHAVDPRGDRARPRVPGRPELPRGAGAQASRRDPDAGGPVHPARRRGDPPQGLGRRQGPDVQRPGPARHRAAVGLAERRRREEALAVRVANRREIAPRRGPGPVLGLQSILR